MRFSGLRHPSELGPTEVRRFLTHLAVERHVSASTQQQALSALLFLYRHVLERPVETVGHLPRGRLPTTLPVVLTREEVGRILALLQGTPRLVATLLYGSGLRLTECLTLWVKDMDLARSEITVRRGKAGKDRVTMVPQRLRSPLQEHVARLAVRHDRDLAEGRGWVEVPGGLAAKYPTAATSWPWQWIFPARRTYWHEESGQWRRHHLHESVVQRAMAAAVRGAGSASGRAVIPCATRSPPTS